MSDQERNEELDICLPRLELAKMATRLSEEIDILAHFVLFDRRVPLEVVNHVLPNLHAACGSLRYWASAVGKAHVDLQKDDEEGG